MQQELARSQGSRLEAMAAQDKLNDAMDEMKRLQEALDKAQFREKELWEQVLHLQGELQ
jgi:butyrate kinase